MASTSGHHVPSSYELWQLAFIGHPVWKHTHGSERVMVDSSAIYFRKQLVFGNRYGTAGWTRNAEAVLWRRCTLGDGAGLRSAWGSREVIFGLRVGWALGGKWGRGGLLELAVQCTQSDRNRHAPETVLGKMLCKILYQNPEPSSLGNSQVEEMKPYRVMNSERYSSKEGSSPPALNKVQLIWRESDMFASTAARRKHHKSHKFL